MAVVHYKDQDYCSTQGSKIITKHKQNVTCKRCRWNLEAPEREKALLEARRIENERQREYYRKPVTAPLPDGFVLSLSWRATFTFAPYVGEYAHRYAVDGRERWIVLENGEPIGRITKYGNGNYVAYDESVEWDGASDHSTLEEACIALSTSYPRVRQEDDGAWHYDYTNEGLPQQTVFEQGGTA